uniref:Transposase n=1 Tax=Strongyloides venezuelensis TaxID=75913 RepID=A0A0K0G5Q2_STRVS
MGYLRRIKERVLTREGFEPSHPKIPLKYGISGIQKPQKKLSGGESNPGLARDRRGYSPLYYQRCHLVLWNTKKAQTFR